MNTVLPMSIALAPHWDERELPANAALAESCSVLGTDDAITLKFAGAGAPAVVLTPYTAKRLLQLLERGLQEHADRHGPA